MKYKRKAISKKTRFEVFKRDSFKCQYCGQSAPDVILHIDHIHPVSKGGDNNIMNLITSCQGCNSGKSNRLLTDNTAIQKQKEQLDELNEKRQQLEMMIEWRQTLRDFDDSSAREIAAYFENAAECEVSDTGIKNIIKMLKRFSYAEILEAIDAAVSQYIKEGSDEEVNHAFSMIPRICSVKKRQQETGEDISHLFYIRGILRNRLSYCNEHLALATLKDADLLGVDELELRDIALESRSWTEWRRIMQEAMEARL